MRRPGSVGWLARHEFRLAWREWLALVTAGRRRRTVGIVAGFLAFAVFMHALASFLVGRYAGIGIDPPRDVLLYVTVIGLLSWSLLISQALEAVTRAFYARSDLDLILSSPVPAGRVFAVRIGAIAATTIIVAVLIAGSFVNALVWHGGPRWIAAYGAVIAAGAGATAIAVGITVLLFRVIGAKRTRFVAQVLAAIIGAMFVIGLQGAAILTYGTFSRFAILQSERLAVILPQVHSPFWWPARAIMGDLGALAAVAALSFGTLALVILLFSRRFGAFAIAAASVPREVRQSRRRSGAFRRATASQALRRKEWILLRRDPWLVSQTLMQLLYLVPAALLLWMKVGEDADAVIVIVPVLVVAAGQLAGGLAWLAVSGEDAPDLIAAAPVPVRAVIRAKVEAVLIAIAVVSTPLLAMLALSNPKAAAVATVAIAVAAVQATAIQLVFRSQAKRSHFRHRQTSSRVATFAEAFSSMAWAATAGLAVSGNLLAAGLSGLGAAGVFLIAWLIRPRPDAAGRRPRARLAARPA